MFSVYSNQGSCSYHAKLSDNVTKHLPCVKIKIRQDHFFFTTVHRSNQMKKEVTVDMKSVLWKSKEHFHSGSVLVAPTLSKNSLVNIMSVIIQGLVHVFNTSLRRGSFN